ncbi:hypothetical protein HHK36_015945 [Tetracentron sinense]|uniref:U5 small nuclear ribonucleoprotein TSSC4 n=1 Tax=Tetracentron sinense TaxID=13715 RepID=A0A834Z402_TETSI|nr:hypothetical protein HHK36_015945 [Tetracentron sinense]
MSMTKPLKLKWCFDSFKSPHLKLSFLLLSSVMDDSFKVRVDRVFGSLASSKSSSLRSSWSLTDEEVERREWNREKDSPDREETPCSSSFDGFFANERKISQRISRNARKELEDPDQDDEDEQLGGGSSSKSVERDDDNEDWEIRTSIGLDPTLDNEEEEDEYDKVALGRENAGDRLYMKDVTDYGAYLNSHNVLPDSFKDVARDPRANHLAAKIRLKEDKEGGSFDSLQASDKTMPAAVGPKVDASEDGGNLKSILKRKGNQTDSKSQKRVRFDPACKDDCEEESEEDEDFPMDTHSMETTTFSNDGSSLLQDAPGVPDYIRNPSKYTRYIFDSSSEVDEESNRRAYMDFLNLVKRSNTEELQPEDTSVDLPKSVTFTPKKKAGDATRANNSTEFKQNHEDACKKSMRRTGFLLGIAAGEVQESEACAMDEDESETTIADKMGSSRKPGRQYRTKTELDDSTS